MRKTMTGGLLTMALAAALPALAQEKPEAPRKRPTALRVEVVFSKYQGEKKVSSLPYTLSVNADDRPTAVRMGIQVPIMTTPSSATHPTWAYKDVGTSMDCSAQALEDGSFRLGFSLEQSSLSSNEVDRKALGGATVAAVAGNPPILRNFKAQTNIVLRDGQTAQYVAATDPVSGEVLKIDVTLRVLK